MTKKLEGYSSKNAGKGRSGALIEFQDPDYAARYGMRASTLVVHDGVREPVFTQGEVLLAIEDEPELPGEMPEKMWEECRKDKATLEEAMRVVVRLTKSGISERLGKVSPAPVPAIDRAHDVIADIYGLYDTDMGNRAALDRATEALYDFIEACKRAGPERP